MNFDEKRAVSVELIEGSFKVPPLDGRYMLVLEACTWKFTREAVVGRFVERSVYHTKPRTWNVLIPWTYVRSVCQPEEESE